MGKLVGVGSSMNPTELEGSSTTGADDATLVFRKRVGAWPGSVVMAAGAAVVFVGLTGFGENDWVVFSLVWGVGVALSFVGFRWFARRGRVTFELVATTAGVRWVENGLEGRVDFAELHSVSLVDNLDMVDYLLFRTSNGLDLKVYSGDHPRLFRFIRRHFSGPMDWWGEPVTDPSAKLPLGKLLGRPTNFS